MIKNQYKSMLISMLSFFIIVTNIFPVRALDNDTSEDNKGTEQVIEVVEETVTPEVSVEPVVSESPDIIETAIPEINDPVESVYPESTVVPEVVVTPTPSEETVIPEEELPQQTPEVVNELVYDSGNIYIYNLQQLLAIGTNVPVKSSDNDENTFGVGEDVYDNDMLITYSLDATYVLKNEISLNGCWNIPEGFSGKFVSGVDPANHNIYDEETNTIYISNSFQLDLISNFYNGKDASPILSNDLDVNMFGAGQLIYPTGSDQFLYYDDTHNYVITTSFTEQRPLNDNLQTQIEATVQPEVTPEIEVYAPEASTNEHLYGRDYVGQVYKEIGESKTRYILIGNKQQLAAIGSDKQVTPMLFLRVDRTVLPDTIIPYYPGDADFHLNNLKETNVNYDINDIEKGEIGFQYKKKNNKDDLMYIEWGSNTLIGGILDGLIGGIFDLVGDTEIVGLKIDADNSVSIGADKGTILGKEAEFTSFDRLKEEYKDLKYSSDANYIIFRDIDLENVDWKPLMFSGYMTGAKAEDGTVAGSLWTNDVINEITISNINVNQTAQIDVEKQSGIGFFGSIMSTSKKQIGLSDKQVVIKNIKLQNVSVQNNAVAIEDKTGLVSGLLKILGGLVGTLLGDLGDALDALLNPSKHKDPTVFATGTFAGRIIGDVLVDNCSVENITNLSNARDILGGFAGHVEGMTEYGKLQEALGAVVKILEEVLNVIPFVDLGTLIEVLLDGKIITLSELVPTGYKTPTITNSSVNQTGDLIIGDTNLKSVGGFAGNMIGSIVKNSRITSNTLTVNGESFVGGFGGFVSNAEIVGLLSEIGLDLNVLHLNSFIIDSNINAANLSVSARGDYSGGMAGALANSFVVDSSINNEISNATMKISANNYAGGFAGIATVGQTIGLGDFQAGQNKLLNTVSKILNYVLANGKGTILLSLIGVSPSVLAGCQLNGNLTVKANVTGGLNGGGDFAGGLVGRGDGVKIISSSKLKEKSFIWKEIGDNLKPLLSDNKTILNGIQSVSGNRYVGGLIGEATTASVAGILNQTLGVGNYLGFDIEDVELNFTQDSVVQATDECAGGLAGRAIGGTITNANVNSLNGVTADNMAGGFIGHGGTGSLGETGGLNILGLIKIDNLVSLADGVVLKINNSNVTGAADGLTVVANGGNNQGTTEVKKYYAGGYIGKSTSVHINNCHVTNLKKVESNMQSGYAGGFAGITETGGLADAANGDTEALKLLGINGLLNAVPYLVSDFKNTTVDYQPESTDVIQVSAAYAGGFIGEMQSGYINNEELGNPYAVSNILNVKGAYYAGGFGGKIYSGGLATAGDLSILGGALNINASDLLKVLNVYIPIIKSAGVSSKGLVVEVTSTNSSDSNSGSAGGYVGYGSGLKISNSHVDQLRHTTVKAPSDLNSDDGSSYLSDQSKYAVKGLRYAGGYVGKLDIGSSAALGSGLGVLGNLLGLNDVLESLDVVASQIEHSNVLGEVGGYSVIANFKDGNDLQGHSGGFAGAIDGSSLQDCNAYNFEYIIGQETAGGYVGRMQPGNVASVVGSTDILGGLLTVEKNLLSILQSFIPMIYNSETTSVPCGGAVRANAASDNIRERGLAGGYVGHNVGGRIEGMSERIWDKNKPTVLRENAAVRIRSVYGYEFAGGFSGRTENANVADTGNLNVLFDVINVSNPLSALGAVYSTESNTAVYGPLRKISVDSWNAWVKVVGINGAYGQQLQQLGKVESQEALNNIIEQYAYGYDVKAAREIDGNLPTQGGVAGGYVGRMDGGKITSANAYDIKLVTSYRSSGGFVGEMSSAGVANVGGIQIGDLDVVGSLPVLETFVPVINTSSAYGYRSGATILANGTDLNNQQGHAGGFAGIIIGGQIKGDENNFCSIERLKTIKGTNTVGGFAGSILSGSAAEVNVGSNDGLLAKILNPILGNSNKLASILKATVSTVKYAKVNAWDDWGVTIDGSYKTDNDPNTKYAYAAGGFVGSFSGSVLGDRENPVTSVIANNIMSVIGGEHVGGFFGLADVAALAQVGDNNSGPILGLIKLGEIDVLDTFRPYIYHGTVNGSVNNGLRIIANTQNESGAFEGRVQTGNAGGFGGTLLNGSVKDSKVINLDQVDALNYSGGFIGHLGKSGTVDLDKVQSSGIINGLLNATAGVLDNFGSHCDRCGVEGIKEGFIVNSRNGKECISGGLVGFADLAKIHDSHVTNIKKVNSEQVAGGFVGRTTFSYLGDIDAGSTALLNPVLSVVNKLLDILYIDNLEKLDAIDIGIGKLLEVELLSGGNALSVTLLGLKISVALVKNNGNGTSDLAQIHIGDSYIEVPCSNIDGIDGNHISEEDTKNINIGLIKSNRTSIKNSSVTGVSIGYDVFGGGANDVKDGTHQQGNAGGFVGCNDEGLFENNQIYYADTIRGTKDKVGPFVGKTTYNSNYWFNQISDIEGNQNGYRVYRNHNDLTSLKVNGKTISAESSNINWNEFVISHINDIDIYDKFKNAILSSGDIQEDAGVYVSPAKAVLMEDRITSDNEGSLKPPPSDMQDPCNELIDLTINKVWKDYGNFENKRPGQIELLLTRTYKENDSIIKEEGFEQTIILTPSQDTKNIWQKVIKDLPAYKELTDGTRSYYTYQVSEKEYYGYSAVIETSEDGFTITVTNSYTPLLPETGGVGTYVFTSIGMIGIVTVLCSFKKGRKRNEKNV